MTPKATTLLAPALGGKTAWLLARYCELIGGREGVGHTLWLTPNYGAAEEVRRGLVEQGLTACLAPNVLTFAQFAERIISGANVPMRPLDAIEKKLVVRGLIESAVARKQLTYFRPIAETDGLTDLVCDLLSDLKRQEIWPDELHQICHSRGGHQKDCELADLYERYQALLNEHHFYDQEGRFWYARDLLRKGQWAPFQKFALVVVDGFADFTRTQHEILSLLHTRTDELFISLPWDDCRGDLFHKSQNTLGELARRLPGLVRQTVPRRPSVAGKSFSSTLCHIERTLFRDPRQVDPFEWAKGMEILAASGRAGEIELLARTIKRLLVEGEAGECTGPVPPGDVLVVFRSTSEVAALVREIFFEYGIPLAIDCGVALERAPAISALIAALRLAIEDWPFRRLLQVVLSNHFRPQWPELENRRAILQVEQSIRSLQIPRGQKALLAALRRLSSIEIDARDDDRRRERVTAATVARGVLERLAGVYERLPTTATAEQWSVALQDFTCELGLLSVACNGDDTAVPLDAEAWDLLRRRLAASAELEVRLTGSAQSLDLRGVLDRIQHICRVEELPKEHDEIGRVRVLSAAQARGIRVPYLFVAGLSEKSFPASLREDRIYSAAEHRELNRAGLRFVERHERACEEMLLFYEVVTRATRRLWLSYSALDEAAQPLSPSPYVREIERLFRAGTINRIEAPDLSPIPRETEPCCPRDLRVKAMAMAIEGSPRLAARLFRQPQERSLCDSLCSAVRTQAERSRRDRFGKWEGMLLGPLVGRRLNERFGVEHCWSTSQLEQYGYCPHQFFLQHVLKLREVDELSLEPDSMLRGRRVHSFFADLHRRLNESDGPRLPSECEAEMYQKLVDETLGTVMRRTASDSPLESALDEIDHLLIARWVQKYLQQYRQYDEAFSAFDERPRPMHFEVSFGPAKEDSNGATSDALSQPVAYELNCNGATIRLTGRIDRIDIGMIAGQVVFNILDYKTSASHYYRASDIVDCKALQLPLYAMAVEDLLLADRKALAWHGGYWHVRDTGFHAKRGLAFHEQTADGLKRTELWANLRERLVDRVGRLIAGVRGGEFPMHCEDEHCSGRCQYKTVCRVNAVRSLEKSWQPPPPNLE